VITVAHRRFAGTKAEHVGILYTSIPPISRFIWLADT